MVSKKINAHTPLFSKLPFVENIPKWEKLPFLDTNVALACVLISGIVLVGLIIQAIVSVDPYATHYWVDRIDTIYFLGVLLTLVVTLKIADKQWHYYYKTERRGLKYGIFQEKIRQVNNRENSLDKMLALIGGFLIAMTLTPIFWFLGLSCYSFTVCARCLITLRRPIYVSLFKKKVNEKIPDWYKVAVKKLDEQHRGLRVKAVLAGWVVSTAVLSCSSLITFLILLLILPSLSLVYAFILHIIFLFVNLLMWFGLSSVSYRIRESLLDQGRFSYDDSVFT